VPGHVGKNNFAHRKASAAYTRFYLGMQYSFPLLGRSAGLARHQPTVVYQSGDSPQAAAGVFRIGSGGFAISIDSLGAGR
jgi:hypothetical protein